MCIRDRQKAEQRTWDEKKKKLEDNTRELKEIKNENRGSTLKEPAVAQASLKKRWCGRLSCSDFLQMCKKTVNKEVMISRTSVSKTQKLCCILIAEVYLTNILPPVLMILPLGFF